MREFKILTQDQLALMAGMDLEVLQRIEQGNWDDEPEIIQRLADTLKCSVIELYNSKHLIIKQLEHLIKRIENKADR